MAGKSWNWHRVASVVAPLSLVLLVVLLYGQSLSHQLVWDDEDNIVNNPALRQSPFAGGFLASPAAPTRLLANLSFAVEYRLWGLNPQGYHATNLFLHLVNSLLVYALAMGLSGAGAARADPMPSRSSISIMGAWLGGVLFAVHPVHVETVNSIALGRGYLLATAFGLMALRWVAAAIGPSNQRGWLWAGAAGAALCALFSHEIGAVVVVLAAVVWLRRRQLWDNRRQSGLLESIGLAAVGVVLVLSSLWVVGGLGEIGSRLEPFPAVAVLMVKQLVAPIPLCIWYDYAAVGEPVFLGPIAGVALMVALLLAGMTYVVRRDPLATLSFFLMLLALTPVLARQVIPFPPPSVMGERWLYLPSVFFALWVGSLVKLGRGDGGGPRPFDSGHGQRPWALAQDSAHTGVGAGATNSARGTPPLARLAAGVLVSLLFMAGVGGAVYTAVQTGHWQNNLRLFRHAVQHCPPSAYLHAALGKAYYDRGETAKARKEFLAAAMIDPSFPRARIGLGIVALDAGELMTAWRELSAAVARAPSDADARNGLGEVYFQLGRYDEAIDEFRQAIALRSSLSVYSWNLAVALMKVDRLEEAISQWERVLAISPDPAERETAREQIELLKRVVAGHGGP